ncbi:DMT family transporter [Comamonas sp. J-3]|uniref:DMT family transporter n=1 Tax=Comamonas trifloxystrobinivorans TaxID=3350256 RepID=UPI00372C97E4
MPIEPSWAPFCFTFAAHASPDFPSLRAAPAMLSWAYLLTAIVAEVIATSALKASDGFSKLLPSVITVAGYAVAFYCLSLTLRHIPVGVAYAVWSGLGVVLITAVAWLVFGQKLDLPALIGIGLIVAGVVVMNVFSKVTAH